MLKLSSDQVDNSNARAFHKEVARAATQRKKFDPSKIDVFSVHGKFAFMDIPEPIIESILQSDGRILGILMDHALAARYQGFTATKSSNTGGHDIFQDLKGGETKQWEVKCWTNAKSSPSLAPSKMVGAGRSVDPKAFKSRAKKLTGGYIVVDVRKFPTVRVIPIPTKVHAELGYPHSLNRDHMAILDPAAVAPATTSDLQEAEGFKFTGSAAKGFELVDGPLTFTLEKVKTTKSKTTWNVMLRKKVMRTLVGTVAEAKAAAIVVAKKARLVRQHNEELKALERATPNAPSMKRSPSNKKK